MKYVWKCYVQENKQTLEKQLDECYRIYCLHQVRQDMPFISRENYRVQFEEIMVLQILDQTLVQHNLEALGFFKNNLGIIFRQAGLLVAWY